VSVAAALIEGLTLGWPSWSELPAHHDAALRSKDPTLRLVGIAGRVETGRANNEDRDALIQLLAEFPRIDYWDQPQARELLIRRWPDDDVVITKSLECLEERRPVRDGFERESATCYLLRCSPTCSRVTEWVKEELTKDYPFVLAHHGAWPLLAPFAAHSPETRVKIIDHIISEKGRAFLHDFQDLIVALNDQRLRDWLLDIARKETDFSLYWAVRGLIRGWGRADPLVRALLDDIAEWEDQRLLQLLSILPEIMTDRAACRTRLIAIGQSGLNLRSDLLAAGFVALACTADDDEVISLLLASLKESGAPAFDGANTVLANFPTHPDVRRFALECLEGRDPPLSVLARSYETDPLIRPRILAYANCLPTALRKVVIEDADNEVQKRPAAQNLLRVYDVEVDTDLKIRSSIHYHSQLKTASQEDISDHIEGLLQTAQAVGPDLHERRAAAFAGILVFGGVARIAAMREFGDKPMRIQTGSGYGRESDSLMGLIAERWEAIQVVFGSEFSGRFGDFGGDAGHMWDCLAPHIGRSEFARRDFISYCEQGDSTLGLQGFRALARERPGSDLLLGHCWKVLQGQVSGQHARHSPWGIRRARLEIARILRNQFARRDDVRDRLREGVTREQGPDGLIALALFSPADEMLKDLRSTPLEIGVRYRDWTCAVHLAGARSDVAAFGEVVCAMVNRDSHNLWDFQEVTNAAVIERLQMDSLAARHLMVGLARQATENERASIPRYLAEAGLMDRDLYDLCRSLLQEERENHGFVRAGFDAVDNSIRSISQSLLHVLSSSSVL
jgi:hypothetical protein